MLLVESAASYLVALHYQAWTCGICVLGPGSQLACLVGILVTLAVLEESETLLVPRMWPCPSSPAFLHSHAPEVVCPALPRYPANLASMVLLWYRTYGYQHTCIADDKKAAVSQEEAEGGDSPGVGLVGCCLLRPSQMVCVGEQAGLR